jgi:F-type H+-transporting ATPase subunit b
MNKTVPLYAAVLILASSVAWAGPASDTGDAGIFSGSFSDALWTVIAFVILLVVLGKVAWKPLLTNLNARQNHIARELKSAEDSRLQAEHMLEDYKQQGLRVVQQAAEQAQRQQQQAAEKTREEVQAIRRRAQEDIESARAAAMDDLWTQAGDIVLRVSGEVVGRTLTPQDNQRLLDEAVTRIRQNGGLQ